MKSTFPVACFVGLFLCLAGLLVVGNAQDGSQDKSDATQKETAKPKQLKFLDADVTASGVLEQTDDGRYRAKFDFGRLPAGLNAVCELKIQNPFDKKISFSGVSKKCKCSNFRPERYYFSPNEELKVKARLKLPIRRNTAKAQTTMMIENKGVPVANLIFDYELDGLLSFSEFIGIIGFDSDNQTKTLDMPFIATSPVNFEKLKLEPTENLKGCKFELVKQDESGLVRITVDDSILTKSKIRGEVMITEEDSNRRDTFFLTIKNDKLAEISPEVVTFKNESGAFSASATLKMSKKIPDDESLAKVKLNCQFGEQKLEASLKRISEKLVQVVLSTDKDLAADNQDATGSVLRWTVVQDDAVSNLETPFVISK